MCILLSSTEHPDYPFILLSNRDEYFRRPTEPAKYRSINKNQVLSPVDLGRPEHGTWIGVDKTGRLAVLVNFREAEDVNVISEVSRGILPIDYLGCEVSDDEWYDNLETSLSKRIVNGEKLDKVPLRRVGGFSLLYGKLRIKQDNTIENLNIISNRGDKGTVFDGQETTIGLSNSLFLDPWYKVLTGKEVLHKTIEKAIKDQPSQAMFVESLFQILCNDNFDKSLADKPMMEQIQGLKSTIFVPPLDTKLTQYNETIGKYYGTRTQTVILLHKSGQLHYYERNLHSSDDIASEQPLTQYFTFKLESE